MRIVYILKKGLSCYPPCLSQVLSAHELGYEIVVYHGRDNSANFILDSKGIEHHLLESDRKSKNTFESAINLMRYNREIKKVLKKIGNDELVWFGNAESALMLKKHTKNIKYIISVLELYDNLPFYKKRLVFLTNHSLLNICCEEHRAQIMVAYYGLKEIPFVVPNKPYEIEDLSSIDSLELEKDILNIIKNKRIILYQGIISKDRPLIPVALALKELDSDVYFAIMGSADNSFIKEIKKIYDKTIHIPHIEAPRHLAITKYASIGIANYDLHILNNIFCAPNKIFEYSKFGIPMLVSNNIGLKETVGLNKCGECVDFNDIGQIKEAIKKILNNPHSYSQNAADFYSSVDLLKLYDLILSIAKERFEK
jgi:glycosyltransferase involved in cell wall biosynthesis